MKKDNEDIRIRNIPLKAFIEHLTDIYEQGGVYIDIVANITPIRDSLGIIVYGEPPLMTDTDLNLLIDGIN